jgi:hypothetical protein
MTIKKNCRIGLENRAWKKPPDESFGWGFSLDRGLLSFFGAFFLAMPLLISLETRYHTLTIKGSIIGRRLVRS